MALAPRALRDRRCAQAIRSLAVHHRVTFEQVLEREIAALGRSQPAPGVASRKGREQETHPYWRPRPCPPCFAVLGIARTQCRVAIHKAFRRRARELHPDRGGSHEAFVALQLAEQQALALAA
jgi:hypothetical protein